MPGVGDRSPGITPGGFALHTKCIGMPSERSIRRRRWRPARPPATLHVGRRRRRRCPSPDAARIVAVVRRVAVRTTPTKRTAVQCARHAKKTVRTCGAVAPGGRRKSPSPSANLPSPSLSPALSPAQSPPGTAPRDPPDAALLSSLLAARSSRAAAARRRCWRKCGFLRILSAGSHRTRALASICTTPHDNLVP
jgi:hypothetical protein